MIGDSTGLPESHILVLTSLILTDEIFDMRATTKGREQQYTEITHENHALKNAIQDLNQKITALEQEIAQAQTQPYSATDLDHSNQEELASTIQSMTIQIEKLAQKVASL
jgi:predicted RNase H-like nuclease (RuvC/YqgF family)